MNRIARLHGKKTTERKRPNSWLRWEPRASFYGVSYVLTGVTRKITGRRLSRRRTVSEITEYGDYDEQRENQAEG